MKASGTTHVAQTSLVILKQTAEKGPGNVEAAHDASALSDNRAGEG